MKFKLFPVLLICVYISSSCIGFSLSENSIQAIGAWGPIKARLNDTSDNYYLFSNESPDKRIELESLDIGTRSILIPFLPLEIGGSYTLVKEGELTDGIKKFMVREPCLVYMNGIMGDAEIFINCPDQNPKQLTRTNAKVLDYQVSNFGDRIFYSVAEGENGSVLNEMKADGSDLHQLFDCSPSICFDLAVTHFSDKIAFLMDGNDSEILLLDLASQEITKIGSSGSDLKFSPDGQYFSFFDISTNQLTIINLLNMEKIYIASSSGLVGEWSCDSKTILYGSYDYWGGIPGVTVHEFNVKMGSDKILLSNQDQEHEYYAPSYTGDEGVFFAMVRQRNAGPSSQLCLLEDDGAKTEVIIQDPLFHYSSFSWNSDYTQLAFQRYPINNSNGSPEIIVWDQRDKSIQIVAEKGTKPLFLP